MNPNQSLKKLRIFAASPSDVANERARLATVVEELRSLAEYVGVTLELVDWRKVVPDLGRPEQVILDQLQPNTWDIFIGILWHRFGTPTKGVDAQAGQTYLSGTEEEFRLAYGLWKQHQRPRVIFYWCKRNPPYDELDPMQFKQVKDFFAGFAPDKDHPGLYQTFNSGEYFERLVRQNMIDFLLEYSQKEKGRNVSAREIQALVPRPPDTLPRRQTFFGRKEEIAQALRALSPEDRGWGVMIDGIGGIGKTALAIEVAYVCKERGLFDAFVFVTSKRDRLRPTGIINTTFANTELDGLLNETARAIGRQGIAQLANPDKQRVLLDALRGMRTLLIFDNLETLIIQEQAAIGEFLRELPVECKAIITSRRRTGEAAVTIRLEKLHWDEAKELIADQMARDANVQRLLARPGEPGWKQLYDEAGGSPLALLWTIGLMQARGLSFEKALALLRDGRAESDLNAFIYREAHKKMDVNERATLGALSLFGGPATFEALSATAELDRRVLDSVLERLRALSLVDVIEGASGEERYTLHALTRRFARADLATEAQAEYATGMRFARYWMDFANKYGRDSQESYKTYNRLDTEWANVEATVNWLWETAAVQDNTVKDQSAARMLDDLAYTLNQFLSFSGRWDERIQLNIRAYEAACAMNNWRIAGWRAYFVARTYYYRARTEETSDWTKKCDQAWSEKGNKSERTIALRIRGQVAQLCANYDEAEQFYLTARANWRELKDDQNTAIVLNSLGELYREREDYVEAERYYREALKLHQKQNDKKRIATVLGNLGEIAIAQEQWADARQLFEQENTLAREIGRINLIAQAQYGLSRVCEKEGRLDLALQLASEALTIRERLQHRNLAATCELVARLTMVLEKKEL